MANSHARRTRRTSAGEDRGEQFMSVLSLGLSRAGARSGSAPSADIGSLGPRAGRTLPFERRAAT
jgi:hypothetical protein